LDFRPVLEDGGVHVEDAEDFLGDFLALRHEFRESEQEQGSLPGYVGEAGLPDRVRYGEDVVAEDPLPVEERPHGDLHRVQPVLDPELEHFPVGLVDLRRAQFLDPHPVYAFVDYRLPDDLVNVYALLGVAGGDHALGDGPQLRHGGGGDLLDLGDRVAGGPDVVVAVVVVVGGAGPGGGAGGAGGDGFGVEVGPVHGEDLVELLLEPLHGDLHEALGEDELLGGGVLGDQEVHGLLEVVDALDEPLSLGFALVEEGGHLGVIGGFRVPFQDQGSRGVDYLAHHRVGEAPPSRRRDRGPLRRRR
ncbi:hypothetical protein TorRG33x02_014250, partial [Trema orientale]